MKLSASTSYAIVASCHLARNQGNGCIQSGTISEEYNIPLDYLLKILQLLVKARIIVSKRGPRGGFTFYKQDATLKDVIQAAEGPAGDCVMSPDFGKLGPQIAMNIDTASGLANEYLASVKITDI